MNSYINERCKEFTSYSPRKKTDTLFQLPTGSFSYTGYFDESAKLIQNNHLTDSSIWKLFVDQYRYEGDAKTLAWRGEFWGKMMRGAVYTYEYTQDSKLYDTLVETVKDMLSAQQEDGRYSSYNRDVEFDGWDLWGRKYVLLGFQYFLDICKCPNLRQKIVDAMCSCADYIMKYVGLEQEGKKLITKCSRAWFGLNSASILEPFVRLYNITKRKEYFDFAEYIVGTGGVSEGNVFEMAYEDKLNPYEYITNKAYEMMSCFEGLLEFYRVTGIEKYKTAVINFAKRVIASDITIIGSSGCTHELFDNSSLNQLNTKYGNVVQETCVTVTWMKYCNQLLSITADPIFADQLELSAYNAMAGAVNSYNIKNINYGLPFDSYSPLLYSMRARTCAGFMIMDGRVYGCCAAIGAAGTGIIPLSSAMLSKDGLYMNLYIPGVIRAQTPLGNEFTLNVDTEYPKNGSIKITLGGNCAEEMLLAFRIPSYSKMSTISINGSAPKEVSSGYTAVNRAWKTGDIVEINLDVRVRTFRCEGVDGSGKYHVALYKGPVVLARDARLGEKIDTVVDIKEDENGFVDALESDSADFPTNLEYKIPMKDGNFITMIDYASAGKTWDRDSVMTAWLATKDYWSLDYNKPFKMIKSMTDHDMYVDEEGYLRRVDDASINPAIWELEPASEGYYRIKDTSSGKYITVSGNNPEALATLEDKKQCDCQIWKLVNLVQDKYYIVSKKNNCTLYEKPYTPYFKLFALDEGADMSYPAPEMLYFRYRTEAVIRINNI